MNEAEILEELVNKVDAALKAIPDAISLISDGSEEDKTKEALQRINSSIIKLSESIDGIQLITKYVRFDVEATRRERDRLRGLLEDKDR